MKIVFNDVFLFVFICQEPSGGIVIVSWIREMQRRHHREAHKTTR